MIRRPFTKPGADRDVPDDTDDDESLWSALRNITAAFALAQRENVLPQADAAHVRLPLWVQGRGWGLRSAAVLGVLFLVLGFVAGRQADTLPFQSADATLSFALTEETAWQTFIAALSLSGEANDIVK
jgi:hypothetical protein